MTRMLGIILAAVLAAPLVPQGAAPAEAANKKAKNSRPAAKGLPSWAFTSPLQVIREQRGAKLQANRRGTGKHRIIPQSVLINDVPQEP